MGNYRIPNIVKHCCIAIYREGGVTAKSQKDRFKQSLAIARSRLAEYGFVILAGEKLSDPVGLTPKGQKAEMRHKREGRSKTVLFDTLYDKFDIDGSKAAAEKKAKDEAAKLKEQITEKSKEKVSANKKTPAGKTLPKGKKLPKGKII